MRIFLGLEDIAGYYANLKKGFDNLDIPVCLVTKEKHPFKYGNEDNGILIGLYRYFYGLNKRSRKSYVVVSLFVSLLYQFSKSLLFIWALMRFDVFIFCGFSTFANYRGFSVLKRFNKKIICVFHGSDSRPPYLNAKYNGLSVSKLYKLCQVKKNQLSKVEKFADYIICNPPQGHFHQRKFISRMYIGSPITHISKDIVQSKDGKDIVLLHAPSRDVIKGTSEIREIVGEIVSKGYNVEYKEISGLPHDEVMKEIFRSDIVIDQMYSDFPLTGIVREAAYCGKPAVIGGYYADYLASDYEKALPVCYCHPERLGEELIRLIESRELRLSIGAAAQAFINEQGDPSKVASRFLQIIDDKVPDEWYYDPQRITYYHGFGMNESRVKEKISEIIKYKGIKGLLIEDKPALQQSIKEFVALE